MLGLYLISLYQTKKHWNLKYVALVMKQKPSNILVWIEFSKRLQVEIFRMHGDVWRLVSGLNNKGEGFEK